MNNTYNPITGFNPIVEQQIEQQIQSVTVEQLKKVFQSKIQVFGNIPKRMCWASNEKKYLENLDDVLYSSKVYDPEDLEWKVLQDV